MRMGQLRGNLVCAATLGGAPGKRKPTRKPSASQRANQICQDVLPARFGSAGAAQAKRKPKRQSIPSKRSWGYKDNPAHWLLSGRQILKRHVQNRVFSPIFVIKVPPFGLVHRKSFLPHRPAQQVAVPAL